MLTVGRNALGNEEIVAFLILCIPFSLFAHMDSGDPLAATSPVSMAASSPVGRLVARSPAGRGGHRGRTGGGDLIALHPVTRRAISAYAGR